MTAALVVASAIVVIAESYQQAYAQPSISIGIAGHGGAGGHASGNHNFANGGRAIAFGGRGGDAIGNANGGNAGNANAGDANGGAGIGIGSTGGAGGTLTGGAGGAGGTGGNATATS